MTHCKACGSEIKTPKIEQFSFPFIPQPTPDTFYARKTIDAESGATIWTTYDGPRLHEVVRLRAGAGTRPAWVTGRDGITHDI